MKNINWKLFAILLGSCIVAGVMVLPYEVALSPVLAKVAGSKLLIAVLVQALVAFSVAIFIGLFLGKRVGLGLPILESALKGENISGKLKSILWLSIGWGVASGLLIILLSFLFPQLSVTFLGAESSVATWKGLLASFYGGIDEEVFLRLFVMTVLVWIIWKFRKAPDGRPTNGGLWLAIILSSILFGLGHLGITGDLTAITPLVVLRAILLNGVAGLIFGWLYWKKGLESAMIAHFSADIVLHVITPVVASIFISR
ncbi:MAG: CPBP family intramembrane glutamic endopeptidase [Candidatus Saccharibacteria bacterium]